MICSECSKYINPLDTDTSDDEDSTEKYEGPPPYSIAVGVDFGAIHQLEHLTPLNTMERAILARVRQYRTVIKINLSGKGICHTIKGNIISLDQNAPKFVTQLFQQS